MKIGGEFEIDYDALNNHKSNLPKKLNHGYFYSSGRAALFHILDAVSSKHNKNKILLPDYLCDTIIETVAVTSFSYDFYGINADLSVDLNSLKSKYDSSCSLLLVNYFGGIDINSEIQNIRSFDKNALIILDNVQAFYNMFEDYDVEYSFTSFRKQFPVPDGAWVISKHNDLKQVHSKNTFAQYKLAGGLIKSLQKYSSISDELYLELFKKGEKEILDNLNSKISDITITILSNLKYDNDKEKRLQNSRVILKGLSRLGIEPILKFKEGMVPLFIPILLKARDRIRLQLKKNNVYLPVHWPLHPDLKPSNKLLYDHELSLIVDQRYNEKHMLKILSIIEENLDNEN